MKTIKIIDLLNKIAKGEEVPKYIRYRDISKHEYNIMMVCKENIIFRMDQCVLGLNDEVEIIEEEKEIEKLGYFNLCKSNEDGDLELTYTGVADTFDEIYEKINELIDAVNELKGKSE